MQTVLFAAGASLPLFVGAVLGVVWSPPKKLLATALAFAAGALISAVAYELFESSYRDGGLMTAALGFGSGAVVFVVLDTILDRVASSGSALGFALLAGVTIDGIPENTALGVSLIHDGSVALLIAVLASNLPEGLSGAAKMHQDGKSKTFVLALWGTATLLLAGAVLAGRWVFASASPEQLAFPLAVAGGAVLASVVDTIAPEAFEEGGPAVALASAAGFVTAFMLSH